MSKCITPKNLLGIFPLNNQPICIFDLKQFYKILSVIKNTITQLKIFGAVWINVISLESRAPLTHKIISTSSKWAVQRIANFINNTLKSTLCKLDSKKNTFGKIIANVGIFAVTEVHRLLFESKQRSHTSHLSQ